MLGAGSLGSLEGSASAATTAGASGGYGRPWLSTNVVERSLPGLRPALAAYAILPGRVVGTPTRPTADEEWGGHPTLTWQLEPRPIGEPNGSAWTLLDEETASTCGNVNWEEKAREFRRVQAPDEHWWAIRARGPSEAFRQTLVPAPRSS